MPGQNVFFSCTQIHYIWGAVLLFLLSAAYYFILLESVRRSTKVLKIL